MSSSPSPTVAAVVVHYRTPQRLILCLEALRRQTIELKDTIVVDNSFPSTITGPPPAEPWRLVRASQNLGFAAASNAGAALCGSDYLLLLNADVVIADDALARLLEHMQGHSTVAVIGPRIIADDGEVELSARAFPSLRTGLFGRSSLATKLLRRAGATPSAVAGALEGQTRRVDWVSGACMLIRRRAFVEVGGFDEAFWMYWEDADLCRRLRHRGWDTAFCAEARAGHATGSSGRSERTVAAFHDAAARYYANHLARTRVDAALARGVLDARRRMLSRTVNPDRRRPRRG